jgi:hypothetical protein
MTPAISMTRGAGSPLTAISGPSPDLLDFVSIPSDAMTPWPPPLLAPYGRITNLSS